MPELTKRLRSAYRYARTVTDYYIGRKETMNEIPNYFETANKIIERAHRGLPHDRWMIGNKEMEDFIKAYSALLDACNNMHKDLIKKGFDAMATDPDNT